MQNNIFLLYLTRKCSLATKNVRDVYFFNFTKTTGNKSGIRTTEYFKPSK